MFYSKYDQAINSPNVFYILKVELLNEDETISRIITSDLFSESGNLKVSLKNGVRRTVNLVLDNSLDEYDIDISSLWLFQKFRLYVGIEFTNEENKIEQLYFPQGVFYIINPQQAYNPSNKTIEIEGVDKWARLDGSLGGTLGATYSFPKRYTDLQGVEVVQQYNMFDIIKNLLKTPTRTDLRTIAFIPEINASQSVNKQINDFLESNGFNLTGVKYKEAVINNRNNRKYYCSNHPEEREGWNDVLPIWEEFKKKVPPIDSIEPLLNNWFLTDDVLGTARVLAPYSISKKMGSKIEDILFEINTILGGNIYYNRAGQLVLEPTQNQTEDSQKEVVWSFAEGDNVLLEFTESFNFEGIYNQVVAQGSVAGSETYTVWVQDDNPASPVSIDKIGTKTIVYDNLGTYDYRHFMETAGMSEAEAREEVKKTLREYAAWLLKRHISMYNTATIKCAILPHLDVNQVVEVFIKGKNRKFLINEIDMSLSPTGTMSLRLTSVVDLKEEQGEE